MRRMLGSCSYKLGLTSYHDPIQGRVHASPCTRMQAYLVRVVHAEVGEAQAEEEQPVVHGRGDMHMLGQGPCACMPWWAIPLCSI